MMLILYLLFVMEQMDYICQKGTQMAYGTLRLDDSAMSTIYQEHLIESERLSFIYKDMQDGILCENSAGFTSVYKLTAVYQNTSNAMITMASNIQTSVPLQNNFVLFSIYQITYGTGSVSIIARNSSTARDSARKIVLHHLFSYIPIRRLYFSLKIYVQSINRTSTSRFKTKVRDNFPWQNALRCKVPFFTRKQMPHDINEIALYCEDVMYILTSVLFPICITIALIFTHNLSRKSMSIIFPVLCVVILCQLAAVTQATSLDNTYKDQTSSAHIDPSTDASPRSTFSRNVYLYPSDESSLTDKLYLWIPSTSNEDISQLTTAVPFSYDRTSKLSTASLFSSFSLLKYLHTISHTEGTPYSPPESPFQSNYAPVTLYSDSTVHKTSTTATKESYFSIDSNFRDNNVVGKITSASKMNIQDSETVTEKTITYVAPSAKKSLHSNSSNYSILFRIITHGSQLVTRAEGSQVSSSVYKLSITDTFHISPSQISASSLSVSDSEKIKLSSHDNSLQTPPKETKSTFQVRHTPSTGLNWVVSMMTDSSNIETKVPKTNDYVYSSASLALEPSYSNMMGHYSESLYSSLETTQLGSSNYLFPSTILSSYSTPTPPLMLTPSEVSLKTIMTSNGERLKEVTQRVLTQQYPGSRRKTNGQIVDETEVDILTSTNTFMSYFTSAKVDAEKRDSHKTVAITTHISPHTRSSFPKTVSESSETFPNESGESVTSSQFSVVSEFESDANKSVQLFTPKTSSSHYNTNELIGTDDLSINNTFISMTSLATSVKSTTVEIPETKERFRTSQTYHDEHISRKEQAPAAAAQTNIFIEGTQNRIRQQPTPRVTSMQTTTTLKEHNTTPRIGEINSTQRIFHVQMLSTQIPDQHMSSQKEGCTMASCHTSEPISSTADQRSESYISNVDSSTLQLQMQSSYTISDVAEPLFVSGSSFKTTVISTPAYLSTVATPIVLQDVMGRVSKSQEQYDDYVSNIGTHIPAEHTTDHAVSRSRPLVNGINQLFTSSMTRLQSTEANQVDSTYLFISKDPVEYDRKKVSTPKGFTIEYSVLSSEHILDTSSQQSTRTDHLQIVSSRLTDKQLSLKEGGCTSCFNEFSYGRTNIPFPVSPIKLQSGSYSSTDHSSNLYKSEHLSNSPPTTDVSLHQTHTTHIETSLTLNETSVNGPSVNTEQLFIPSAVADGTHYSSDAPGLSVYTGTRNIPSNGLSIRNTILHSALITMKDSRTTFPPYVSHMNNYRPQTSMTASLIISDSLTSSLEDKTSSLQDKTLSMLTPVRTATSSETLNTISTTMKPRWSSVLEEETKIFHQQPALQKSPTLLPNKSTQDEQFQKHTSSLKFDTTSSHLVTEQANVKSTETTMFPSSTDLIRKQKDTKLRSNGVPKDSGLSALSLEYSPFTHSSGDSKYSHNATENKNQYVSTTKPYMEHSSFGTHSNIPPISKNYLTTPMTESSSAALSDSPRETKSSHTPDLIRVPERISTSTIAPSQSPSKLDLLPSTYGMNVSSHVTGTLKHVLWSSEQSLNTLLTPISFNDGRISASSSKIMYSASISRSLKLRGNSGRQQEIAKSQIESLYQNKDIYVRNVGKTPPFININFNSKTGTEPYLFDESFVTESGRSSKYADRFGGSSVNAAMRSETYLKLKSTLTAGQESSSHANTYTSPAGQEIYSITSKVYSAVHETLSPTRSESIHTSNGITSLHVKFNSNISHSSGELSYRNIQYEDQLDGLTTSDGTSVSSSIASTVKAQKQSEFYPTAFSFYGGQISSNLMWNSRSSSVDPEKDFQSTFASYTQLPSPVSFYPRSSSTFSKDGMAMLEASYIYFESSKLGNKRQDTEQLQPSMTTELSRVPFAKLSTFPLSEMYSPTPVRPSRSIHSVQDISYSHSLEVATTLHNDMDLDGITSIIKNSSDSLFPSDSFGSTSLRIYILSDSTNSVGYSTSQLTGSAMNQSESGVVSRTISPSSVKTESELMPSEDSINYSTLIETTALFNHTNKVSMEKSQNIGTKMASPDLYRSLQMPSLSSSSLKAPTNVAPTFIDHTTVGDPQSDSSVIFADVVPLSRDSSSADKKLASIEASEVSTSLVRTQLMTTGNKPNYQTSISSAVLDVPNEPLREISTSKSVTEHDIAPTDVSVISSSSSQFNENISFLNNNNWSKLPREAERQLSRTMHSDYGTLPVSIMASGLRSIHSSRAEELLKSSDQYSTRHSNVKPSNKIDDGTSSSPLTTTIKVDTKSVSLLSLYNVLDMTPSFELPSDISSFSSTRTSVDQLTSSMQQQQNIISQIPSSSTSDDDTSVIMDFPLKAPTSSTHLRYGTEIDEFQTLGNVRKNTNFGSIVPFSFSISATESLRTLDSISASTNGASTDESSTRTKEESLLTQGSFSPEISTPIDQGLSSLQKQPTTASSAVYGSIFLSYDVNPRSGNVSLRASKLSTRSSASSPFQFANAELASGEHHTFKTLLSTEDRASTSTGAYPGTSMIEAERLRPSHTMTTRYKDFSSTSSLSSMSIYTGKPSTIIKDSLENIKSTSKAENITDILKNQYKTGNQTHLSSSPPAISSLTKEQSSVIDASRELYLTETIQESSADVVTPLYEIGTRSDITSRLPLDASTGLSKDPFTTFSKSTAQTASKILPYTLTTQDNIYPTSSLSSASIPIGNSVTVTEISSELHFMESTVEISNIIPTPSHLTETSKATQPVSKLETTLHSSRSSFTPSLGPDVLTTIDTTHDIHYTILSQNPSYTIGSQNTFPNTISPYLTEALVITDSTCKTCTIRSSAGMPTLSTTMMSQDHISQSSRPPTTDATKKLYSTAAVVKNSAEVVGSENKKKVTEYIHSSTISSLKSVNFRDETPGKSYSAGGLKGTKNIGISYSLTEFFSLSSLIQPDKTQVDSSSVAFTMESLVASSDGVLKSPYTSRDKMYSHLTSVIPYHKSTIKDIPNELTSTEDMHDRSTDTMKQLKTMSSQGNIRSSTTLPLSSLTGDTARDLDKLTKLSSTKSMAYRPSKILDSSYKTTTQGNVYSDRSTALTSTQIIDTPFFGPTYTTYWGRIHPSKSSPLASLVSDYISTVDAVVTSSIEGYSTKTIAEYSNEILKSSNMTTDQKHSYSSMITNSISRITDKSSVINLSVSMTEVSAVPLTPSYTLANQNNIYSSEIASSVPTVLAGYASTILYSTESPIESTSDDLTHSYTVTNHKQIRYSDGTHFMASSAIQNLSSYSANKSREMTHKTTSETIQKTIVPVLMASSSEMLTHETSTLTFSKLTSTLGALPKETIYTGGRSALLGTMLSSSTIPGQETKTTSVHDPSMHQPSLNVNTASHSLLIINSETLSSPASTTLDQSHVVSSYRPPTETSTKFTTALALLSENIESILPSELDQILSTSNLSSSTFVTLKSSPDFQSTSMPLDPFNRSSINSNMETVMSPIMSPSVVIYTTSSPGPSTFSLSPRDKSILPSDYKFSNIYVSVDVQPSSEVLRLTSVSSHESLDISGELASSRTSFKTISDNFVSSQMNTDSPDIFIISTTGSTIVASSYMSQIYSSMLTSDSSGSYGSTIRINPSRTMSTSMASWMSTNSNLLSSKTADPMETTTLQSKLPGLYTPANVSKVGVTNLLTIGIRIKTTVNIHDKEFILRLESGLLTCFLEGMSRRVQQGRAKRNAPRTAKKTAAHDDIQIDVTEVKRQTENSENVAVRFSVMSSGLVLEAADALLTFRALNNVETSAYLRYPVTSDIGVVKILRPPEVDKKTFSMTVTLVLILVPVACFIALLSATVIIYRPCRKEESDSDWSSTLSSTMRRQTLSQADLIIDVEKGDIVSRKPSPFNLLENVSKTMNITGCDVPHYVSVDNSTLRRAFSEICSPVRRAERLNKLGISVPVVKGTRTRVNGEARRGDKVQMRPGIDLLPRNINFIEKIDVPCEKSVQCTSFSEPGGIVDSYMNMSTVSEFTNQKSTRSKRFPRSIMTRSLKQETGRQAPVIFENNSTSGDDFEDTDENIRAKIDALVYESDESKTTNETDVDISDDISDEISDCSCSGNSGSNINLQNTILRELKNRLKNCKESDISRQADVCVFATNRKAGRHKGHPVEECSNRARAKPVFSSLTLGKVPRYVNNFIEGDMDDDVFMSDSQSQASSVTSLEMCTKKGKSVRFGNLCQEELRPSSSVTTEYQMPWEDSDIAKLICNSGYSYTDGSEDAGDEFESLNFTSDHQVTNPTTHSYRPSFRYHQPDIMTAMFQSADISEHLTKMTRTRVRKSQEDLAPQFRPLPFQDTVRPQSERSRVIFRSNLGEDPIPEAAEFEPTVSMSPRTSSRPFVEAKLGRNMRAAQRGSFGNRAARSNGQHDGDASEPLLRSNQPQNLVVDYFTNLRAAPKTSLGILSRSSVVTSPRSITYPQHPSQDLIEQLTSNSNQHRDHTFEPKRQSEPDRRSDVRMRQLDNPEDATGTPKKLYAKRSKSPTQMKSDDAFFSDSPRSVELDAEQQAVTRHRQDMLYTDTLLADLSPATFALEQIEEPQMKDSQRSPEKIFSHKKRSEEIAVTVVQPTPRDEDSDSESRPSRHIATAAHVNETVPKQVGYNEDTDNDVKTIEEELSPAVDEDNAKNVSDDDFDF